MQAGQVTSLDGGSLRVFGPFRNSATCAFNVFVKGSSAARRVVVSVLAATAACTGDGGGSVNSTTASSAVTTPARASSTTLSESSSTIAVNETSTTSTLATAETITRPMTDSAICDPRSARGSQFSDHTLTLFAISREAPIAIQIIGNRAGQSFDAFALVERFFTSDIPTGGNKTIDINGNQVRINTYPNGNGDARWKLPDGSIAYLRSRGLDQGAVETIIAGLSPRDPSAAIPGFDFNASTGTSQFELLHEHTNTGLGGNVATLECASPVTGFIYWISAIDADPIVEYAGVIDRPVPLEVGIHTGTLIVINGRPDPSAPTVADVGNADTTTWATLLSNPKQ